MCKHKSGGSRSQQTDASSSANKEGEKPAMRTSPSDYKMERCDGLSHPEKNAQRSSLAPVHQSYSPCSSTASDEQFTSVSEAVDQQETGCTEMSPMLIEDDEHSSTACISCALPERNKTGYVECGEDYGLLQDRTFKSAGDNQSNKAHSRWRSGVVVYPSVGSLTSEWKDDVSQCNSMTNLGTDLLPGNYDNCHPWFLKDCQVYNVDVRPRSVSLTQVSNSLDQYPTCSSSIEQETTPSRIPLTISPSPFLHHKLVKGLQYSSSVASSLTEGGNLPICKICHLTSSNGDPLISPCRCSGTMQFIHCNCLMKWLEYSSKRTRRPPTCELCQYQYHWHKKFKVGQWQFPHCSQRDKLFHFIFFFALLVMIACATITIMCFKQDKGIRVSQDSTELTESEIVTLVCGVLFFVAFFLAMYVEVKARNNIYRLFFKFLYLNQQWYFDEYEKKDNSVVSV